MSEKKSFLRKLARRKRKMALMDEALHVLFTRQCGEHIFALQGLWKNWERAVGGEIAALGRPAGHNGATLYLCAEDSMALQDLKMLSPEILRLANSYLGNPVFSAISLSLHTPAPQPALPIATPVPDRNAPPPLSPPAGFGFLLPELRKTFPDSPELRSYVAVMRYYGLFAE